MNDPRENRAFGRWHERSIGRRARFGPPIQFQVLAKIGKQSLAFSLIQHNAMVLEDWWRLDREVFQRSYRMTR